MCDLAARDKNMHKKLIGYKLKDETLIPVIQKLIEVETYKAYNNLMPGITVETGVNYINCSNIETLKVLEHNKILNLWYEPIYIEEKMFIEDWEVTFNDNYVKIGCKKITIDHMIIIKRYIYDHGLFNPRYNKIISKIFDYYGIV